MLWQITDQCIQSVFYWKLNRHNVKGNEFWVISNCVIGNSNVLHLIKLLASEVSIMSATRGGCSVHTNALPSREPILCVLFVIPSLSWSMTPTPPCPLPPRGQYYTDYSCKVWYTQHCIVIRAACSLCSFCHSLPLLLAVHSRPYCRMILADFSFTFCLR